MSPDPLPEQAPPPPSPEGAPTSCSCCDLPQPAARSRLPLRAWRRAQRRPRLHQGADASRDDLHRGPVPVGAPGRRRLHRGAAPQSGPARHRGGAAVHRPGRVHGPDAAAAGPSPGDAADGERGTGPGRDLRHREPRGHPGVCARQGLHGRRHWATIGSDNFNRRSWTHDSELSAVVVDPSAETTVPTRGGCGSRSRPSTSTARSTRTSLLEVMADCVDAPAMFAAYAETARRLDDWHDNGRSASGHPVASAACSPPYPGSSAARGPRALPDPARPGRPARPPATPRRLLVAPRGDRAVLDSAAPMMAP